MTTWPEKDEHAASGEARELKQGYDDGLFKERDATLADVLDDSVVAVDDDDDDDFEDEDLGWDPDKRPDD